MGTKLRDLCSIFSESGAVARLFRKEENVPLYYVNDNAQSNGDHEVHNDGCFWLSLIQSKTSLGYHDGCRTAVQAAKKIYYQSNGCATCSPTCHTT